MTLGVNSVYSNNIKTESADYRARHLGTALHRTLKQIAEDGINQWPLDRRKTLKSCWSATLRQLGIIATDQELNQLMQSVETMLKTQRDSGFSRHMMMLTANKRYPILTKIVKPSKHRLLIEHSSTINSVDY